MLDNGTHELIVLVALLDSNEQEVLPEEGEHARELLVGVANAKRVRLDFVFSVSFFNVDPIAEFQLKEDYRSGERARRTCTGNPERGATRRTRRRERREPCVDDGNLEEVADPVDKINLDLALRYHLSRGGEMGEACPGG